MRITAPVCASGEVALLASAGADELYCGFMDAWWVERYGDHDSASRRQGAANLATLDDLARTVDAAQGLKVPVRLALNARYTEPQLDRLEWLCDEFEQMGGAGVIVSDLGLLWRLRDRTDLARTLSLLAVAQNVPTLEAAASLGATRVVLPRFVDSDEAGQLLNAAPGMQAEVMAFFDKCRWIDGYCRHPHRVTYPARFVDEAIARADDAEPLFSFDTTYTVHACLQGCPHEAHPCAACFLAGFERAGVGFAKIGGRGRLLEERVAAVRFLKEAQALATDDERAQLRQGVLDGKCRCYYGPGLQSRTAIEPVTHPSARGGLACVGSETDQRAFDRSVAQLLNEDTGESDPVVLLVPPLSQDALERLLACAGELAHACPDGSRLCVNDVGTLVALARVVREQGLGLDLSCGTLLSRIDDPDEVALRLNPAANPPRPVWGLDGEPRTLVYRHPPDELVRHWRTASASEPSSQAALAALSGLQDVPCEFF